MKGKLASVSILLLAACYLASSCSNKNNQATSFDVPSLIGKDVNGIVQILGSPWDDWEPTSDDIEQGEKVWDKSWKSKDEKTFLVVNYLISDRKVINFFIYTKESAYGTEDKNHLLMAGNLKEDSRDYQIKFVRAKDDYTLFTGITVTPNTYNLPNGLSNRKN